jgi:hypothetical protein
MPGNGRQARFDRAVCGVGKTGVKTRMVKDLVYLLNVQLVSAMSQLSENTG